MPSHIVGEKRPLKIKPCILQGCLVFWIISKSIITYWVKYLPYVFSHCERQLDLIRCLNAQMFWMRNWEEALGWWQWQQEGQYEPMNCQKISQAIKMHSAIFHVQDDLILTYIAVISCSPVKKWSYESLLDPFVGKEQVHSLGFLVKPRESWSTWPALENFVATTVSSMWQSTVCSPPCQLASVWMQNKLGVLKCWVSRSATAPDSSAV